MNVKLTLTLLLGFLIVPLLRSQDTRNTQLQLNIGPSLLTRQDLVFSPFIHNSFSLLNGGLELQRNKIGYSFWRLQYAGFESGLATPFEYRLDDSIAIAEDHSFTMLQLAYGCGFKLNKKDSIPPILGFGLQLDVQAMTYQYGLFSFFGYYSTTAFNIWYRQVVPMGQRCRWIGQAEIPVVSWMGRSPYLVNDDEFIENIYSHNGFTSFFEYYADGHLATWNELQRVDIGIQFQYDLSDRLTGGIAYKGSFIHASEPRDLYSAQNNIHLTLGLKL